MNLLIHQAALGDFVLTWPLLRALPRPRCVVAPGRMAALAAAVVPDVQAVDIEVGGWHRLHADDDDPPAGVAAVLARAERVISFVATARSAWAANIARLAPRARLHMVSSRPPADWRGHVGDWHRQQLAQQGLSLSPAHPRRGGKANGPVVVHPGSGGVAKCWPAERFEALIGHARDRGLSVTVILGEAEAERWPMQQLSYWRKTLGARMLTDLAALRAVLAGARAFVGNDAGPTHLAAQMGLPTVAFFGPTDPALWRPAGPAVRVLAPPQPMAMPWLSVEVAAAGLDGLWPEDASAQTSPLA